MLQTRPSAKPSGSGFNRLRCCNKKIDETKHLPVSLESNFNMKGEAGTSRADLQLSEDPSAPPEEQSRTTVSGARVQTAGAIYKSRSVLVNRSQHEENDQLQTLSAVLEELLYWFGHLL